MMAERRRPIALNINFDSLSECLRLSGVTVDHESFVDPCFGPIMDRFRKLAEEYDAPLTIYAIGRDLLSAANRRRVAEWAAHGHEIGNHTWSHPQTLSNMSLDETRTEIERAHEVIGDATGSAPRGFIAPAWSTSPFVVQVLTELRYRYDTSLTPSWAQLVALLKLRLNSTTKVRVPLLRRDLPGLLWGCRVPYRATAARPWRPNDAGLPVLPLPTGRLRLPVWHTMSFVINGSRWEPFLRKAIATNPAFYYLMHPVDLLDPDTDLVGLPGAVRNVERIMVPLKTKQALLRRSLDVMAEQAEFVTMEKLAEIAFPK
jgi:peptidoglycan/xylan/chitin deacetylase (PgdA/CDA1 family)